MLLARGTNLYIKSHIRFVVARPPCFCSRNRNCARPVELFLTRYVFEYLKPLDVRQVSYILDVFHVLVGRTFVFGLRAKKPLKTLKTKT